MGNFYANSHLTLITRYSFRHGFVNKLLAYWLIDSNPFRALYAVNSSMLRMVSLRTSGVSGRKNFLSSGTQPRKSFRRAASFANGKTFVGQFICRPNYLLVFVAPPTLTYHLLFPRTCNAAAEFPPTDHLGCLVERILTSFELQMINSLNLSANETKHLLCKLKSFTHA